MSIKQLWQIIVAGRWIMLLCTLACLGGAMAFGLRLPKTYEARARVLLQVVQPDLIDNSTINDKTMQPYVRTQSLLATSTRVCELIVDKLGWVNNPAVIDAFNATEGAGDIRAWAAARVQQSLIAQPLQGGGTLEIVYQAPDPEAARTIAGVAREAFIETSLALETESAARRGQMYQRNADLARQRLIAAQQSLATEQRAAGIITNSAGADLEAQRLPALAQEAIDARLAASRNDVKAEQEAPRTLESMKLRTELLTLDLQIERASTQYGADNPIYKAMLERRRRLSAQLVAVDVAARSKAGGQIANSRLAINRADAALAAERSRVIGSTSNSARLSQAYRMVQLRQGEYDKLAAGAAQMQLQSTRSESGLVVMGDVIANPDPVAPNLLNIGALALIFGLSLGLMTTLVLGLADREVLGKEDLAFATGGIPVLGVVPRGPGRRKRWLSWFRGRRRRAVPA
ncbi:GumC family protein [Glacieibacterium sp.]|uniref:GumC family protein n=1 Tax=Glacieibacterium sp. TaxID=2860237 RepID=UPI003AFF76AA